MSMVVMGNVWKHEKCRWWLWEMCGSVRNVDSGYGKCVEMREMSMMAMGIYGNEQGLFSEGGHRSTSSSRTRSLLMTDLGMLRPK
ncbi:hypothetical protein AVEN_123750-2 [Araneus ventricosus]|uniref:Uncharacterized protein n=1 Tax=Araneus ventricosus TaxID=182803 RepID=A0A4Y2BJW9_ARAVE|nr:hypothetical protein AVEN_123750-2 [Araneus ventricosus]